MKNLKYISIVVFLIATISCVEDKNMYIEPSPWVDIETITINYSKGPLTSITFPKNPIPGEDVNVKLTYTSSDEIVEARIYFATGDSPKYSKSNKLKGEDDASFTQTGVTINMKDQSKSGIKTSFYVRMATKKAEYYYGNVADGMHLDDTPGGGSTDESDSFKDTPSLWNVFTAQLKN